jgi:hypothetical protein
MKRIIAQEKSLTYKGDTDYALRLVNETRKAYAIAGMDMPKMLNDFVFNIEVELQYAGVLDENFDPIPEVQE